MDRARGYLRRKFPVISEINRKYAVPRLKMTPMVKFSLLLLRLYLLLLVAILFYKFYTVVANPSQNNPTVSAGSVEKK